MACYVYKCNSQQREYQNASGDWDDYLSGRYKTWGSTKWTADLEKLRRGDMILAYQTNRNELVAVFKVRESCDRDTYLRLDLVEEIRCKVRPLKKSDKKIAAIPALQGGPIKTIYDISDLDAGRLLKKAGSLIALKQLTNEAETPAKNRSKQGRGGGFGDPESNALVAEAAVATVRNLFLNNGWKVKSVESEKRGFDLECRKGRQLKCIEVKGIKGVHERFIITRGEVNQAKRNRKCEVYVVTRALSHNSRVNNYSGQEFLKRFKLSPTQFMASPMRSK